MAKKNGILKSVAKYGLIPAVAIGNILTAGLAKVTGKTYGRTTLEEAAQTTMGKILGVGTAATAAALAVAAQPTAVLKLVPKTAVGKAAAVFTGAAAIASPTITQAILETPFKLAAAGKKVGEVVEEMGEEEKTTLEKLGTAGLILGGIATAVGAGALVSKIIGKEDVAIQPAIAEMGMLGSADVMEEAGAQTPQMTDITAKPTRKRRKTRREALQQKISQSVKVYVGSFNRSSKKYLNVIPFCR